MTRRAFSPTRALLLGTCLMLACEEDSGPLSDMGAADPDRALLGGETTVYIGNSQAYRLPAPNVGDLDLHLAGDAAFEAEFVSAPAPVNAGLGPVFNNNACIACHPGDGRGRPPENGVAPESMFLRISIPGVAEDGGPMPVPGFGRQLFDRALFGVEAHARWYVEYSEEPGEYPDGTAYSLRRPHYVIHDAYRPLPGDLQVSPRVAPAVFGRGLLEAVSETTLLELEDPGDADGDGISGRANRVHDPLTGETALGRFGHKASNSSVLAQTAGAYHGDMGVTNSVFPFESSHGQPQADSLADDPELADEELEAAVFYVQTLGVPVRRLMNDPDALAGEELFDRIGCAGCHLPELRSGSLPGVPSVSNQTFRPYTDLLLHDMGEELADGRPDFEADGREWRTAPLWGIGLTYVVSGHTLFLHDGRARSLEEAILWHGGEAEESREAFKALEAGERVRLLRFLESL